jgi:hypothetical protein
VMVLHRPKPEGQPVKPEMLKVEIEG